MLKLKWMKSYLSERSQRVRLNDLLSEPLTVKSGVPQGSHLGPVLFNVFINDLTVSIKYCKYLLYADDMKIFGTVNDENDTLQIQEDLNQVSIWCKKNHMYLNISKCNIISFSKKNDMVLFDYSIENVPVKRTNSINDLGITVDSKLNFKDHIDKIINNGRRVFGFIKRRSYEFKDPYIIKSLYCSLVRSTLEYGSVVWNMMGSTDTARVESIQKQFFTVCTKKPWVEERYFCVALI